MKKTLLIGMFLCGTTMAFAQQPKDFWNVSKIVKKQALAPSEIKRDSIITDGFVTTVYEYAEDGSYTLTQFSYDDKGGITFKSVISYDSNGSVSGITSYNHEEDEFIPFSGVKYFYDSEGNVIASESYSRDLITKKYGLTSRTEYRIEEETKDSILIQKLYDVEGILTQINEDCFDKQGHQTYSIYNWVEDDKTIPFKKDEWKYSDNGSSTGSVSYKWQDGKWVISSKSEYEYHSNGIGKSFKVYNFKDGESVLTSYTLSDEKGNPTEQFTNNVKTVFNYVYAEDGRIKTKIESTVNGEIETPVRKSAYTYYDIESGNYYYRSDNSSSNDGGQTWGEAGAEYFVPCYDTDNKFNNYIALSATTINGINSFFYPIFENGNLKSKGTYTIIDDKLVCIDIVKYTYNEYNDLLREEYYENPKYAEGGSLELVKTINYDYDENALSPQNLAKASHLNLLDCYTTDADGKEISRTTYYYSEYKPATTTSITSVASSDKTQAIYNLNGQKVTKTQAGQIYIKKGKKYIAK